MEKKKKSKGSRVTLRIQPDKNERLDKVAEDLDLSVNAVINYMLSRWLGRLELEAAVFRNAYRDEADEIIEAMERWRAAKPGRTRKQFIRLRLKQLMSNPSHQRPSLPEVTGPVTNPSPSDLPAQPKQEPTPVSRKRKK